jgi:glutaredoxin
MLLVGIYVSKEIFMKYIFRSIRWVLGQLIVFLDWITRPKKPVHTPERKAELDAATANMALYQFKLCPFCVKTRRKVRKLGLEIETRDARNDPKWNAELVNEGGKYQVPCLRVAEENGDVKWIYESSEITDYLDRKFAQS